MSIFHWPSIGTKDQWRHGQNRVWIASTTGVATFHEKAVHASLLVYFEDNFTLFSGENLDELPFDYESATEAVEFDCQIQDAMNRRSGNKKIFRLTTRIHAWAKLSTNLYRALEIADAAATVMHHADIPVYDYDVDSSTVVGYARMQEASAVDRSRDMNAANRTDGRHIVITVPGIAEEL